MAETFGIVAGAVGIATVFSTCMEVFSCVQLGRNFERDYGTSLVTLRLQGMRLSRWGAAAEIYDDPELVKLNAMPGGAEAAKVTLCQILRLFSDSEKRSNKYFSKQITAPSPTVYSVENITDPDLSGIIQQTDNIMVKRKEKRGRLLWKKVTWSLYEKESFEQLIQDISGLLDQLHILFPGPESQRKLLDENIAALEQAVSLKYVQKLAEGVDKMLQDRAKYAQDEKDGRHVFEKVSAGKNARLHTGNAYVKQIGDGVGSVPKGPGHRYAEVRFEDSAMGQAGDMFGASIFDYMPKARAEEADKLPESS